MKEIAALLALWRDKERSSREVRRVATRHLEDLEERIEAMREMSATLRQLVHSRHGDDRADCPILVSRPGHLDVGYGGRNRRARVVGEQLGHWAIVSFRARRRRFVGDRLRMLATISHDLGGPITRLRLRTEQIAVEADVQRKMLGDLDEMAQMVASVLAFSSDEATDETSHAMGLAALLATLCEDAKNDPARQWAGVRRQGVGAMGLRARRHPRLLAVRQADRHALIESCTA